MRVLNKKPRMDYETMLGGILVAFIVVFSLDFDKAYLPTLHNAARHPFARFAAGLAVVSLAEYNPLLAILSLLVVFFWIADVNLLSSFAV
jgi:hypothetical protein